MPGHARTGDHLVARQGKARLALCEVIGAKARWAAALAVLLLIGAQARAQVAPAGVAIEMGAWRFTPVVTQGQSVAVVGFLALMDPSTAEGQNITAVWYAAPVGGGGWVKTAWHSESEWGVIELLKTQLGIGDESDADWETWEEKPTPAPPPSAPGAAYEGGFFLADGFGQAVNTLPNRDDIVALLVELGYAGADLPGESSELETCRRDLLLDAMAAGVATELATQSMGESTAFDTLAACL
jgi:hypothetical protein